MKAFGRTLIFLFCLATPAYADLENYQAADAVVGQPDFTSGTANIGGRSARTLNGPGTEVFSDGKRLIVPENSNHRVLIWNSIPTTNFQPADIVLGQPDFVSGTANNGGVSARSLNLPNAVFSDGKRFFVVDFSNNRVLIWNSIPTSDFQTAYLVLGQPGFTSTTSNNGGLSGQSLSSPVGVFSDGQRLVVTDRGNKRVLIWNSIPTTNFKAADVVLGQPGFNSSTANNGGRSARSLSFPQAPFSDGKRLFVTEVNNNRILIWNSIPTTNFQLADVVLGQPDFTSGGANNSGRSAKSLSAPSGLFSDGKRFFVTEQTNNRVLIWHSIPTANFQPADVVLGQPDFTSGTPNNGGRSAQSLSLPNAVFSDGKRIFVAENANHRVLIYNLSTSPIKLGPQFEQGKAVLGKVFHDLNGNGIQDSGEKGLEGIKVASDTGIYAITDEDGKYHFPYIETGQHLLKLDPSTLPEGSTLTTDSPYKVVVTKGILTKVSFGIRLPEEPTQRPSDKEGPLLKVSVSQDPVILKPRLSMSAVQDKDNITFTIDCNYFLFIEKSILTIYDKSYKKIKSIELPKPIPFKYTLRIPDLTNPKADTQTYYYQLSVYDKKGKEDRTGMGSLVVRR